MKSVLVARSPRDEVVISAARDSALTMLVRNRQDAVFIAKGAKVFISKPTPHCLHVNHEAGSSVILAGQRGPPGIGIPGPAGGSAVQRRYGETLSALKVVYELEGLVFSLDYRDEEHIHLALGVTLTSGEQATLGNVQRSGTIEDSAWTWSPGRVWLGADGSLTQVAPVAGYDLLIGFAPSATRINLTIQDPIELE